MPNDFEKLLRFVEKNKRVPAAIDASKIEQATVLKSAIEDGDYRHAIYDDPQCPVYLLHLIKNDVIPFSIARTQLMYLSMLAQYTARQALKEDDAHYKYQGSLAFKVHTFGPDTHAFDVYIDKVIKELNPLGYLIDKSAFFERLLSLPKAEQALFDLPYDQVGELSKDLMPAILAINKLTCLSEDGRSVYVPSLSIFECLLQAMNPENPCKMDVIFGRISKDTLKVLHQDGLHPVAVYHPLIQTNLLGVHGRDCGPAQVLLHDLGHVFMANFLTGPHYRAIVEHFIPILDHISTQLFSEEKISAVFKAEIDFVIGRLNDFDFQSENTEYFLRFNKNYFLFSKKEEVLNLFLKDCLSGLFRTNSIRSGSDGRFEVYSTLCRLSHDNEQSFEKKGIDIYKCLEEIIPSGLAWRDVYCMIRDRVWDKKINQEHIALSSKDVGHIKYLLDLSPDINSQKFSKALFVLYPDTVGALYRNRGLVIYPPEKILAEAEFKDLKTYISEWSLERQSAYRPSFFEHGPIAPVSNPRSLLSSFTKGPA